MKTATTEEKPETFVIAFVDHLGKPESYYAPFPMGYATACRSEAFQFKSFAELQKGLEYVRSERFFHDYGCYAREAVGLTNANIEED
jgi:hypothetical protein